MKLPTTQALFDHVVNHLLTQGERAEEANSCKYLMEDGRKCAVGCLIEIEHYSTDIEGCAVEKAVLTAVENSIGRKLQTDEPDLLYRLQRVHDNSRPKEWALVLRDLAGQVGLTFNYGEFNA